ncbi:MAG: VWA domain-containing protein [Myxococcales bacterium]|nr:VWA domain-containing protein [Myxococcota bacterium]MDW8281543.1 VWA domain-containing protein [Myxococcales bacterium]
MSKIKEFTVATSRPLPVILLADISGSMGSDGKINALNTAVQEMLSAFAEEDTGRAEIHVAIVTFGGSASLHIPLQPARQVRWTPMQANGGTPLGAALNLVTDLIEDREKVPSRAYRPSIVLVSDGMPTDEWREPLARLLSAERAKKAQRFALGIGADADHNVLQEFLADPEARVLQAHEAREIRKFFRWVTMSVTSRSRSLQPNQVANVPPPDLDDYGSF